MRDARLQDLLEASAALHRHLCPRQVLGVRMGLHAGEVLGLPVPQTDKRLFAIVETDGCAADGVSVATNCWVGRRTLRVEDLGKLAATFVDTQSERAIRLVPRPEVRAAALAYASDARGKWQRQLLGYQRMPAEELLQLDEVELLTPVAEILSDPGARAICRHCREEIINAREVVRAGRALCRTCAGDAYYRMRTADCVLGQAPHDRSAQDGRRLSSSVRS